MSLLLILLILILVGVVPIYPYSRGWGYGPVGIIVVILILLLLFGGWPVRAEAAMPGGYDPNPTVFTEEEMLGTIPDPFARREVVQAQPSFDPVNPGRVTPPIRVIDGDTVAIGIVRYRLVGYDTPETFAVENPCPAEVQLGKIATTMLKEFGQDLQVTPVPCWDGKPTDRYGRTCAQASYKGEAVADIFVGVGLATRLATDRPDKRIDWCLRPGGLARKAGTR